jgi:hypothetical protein
MSLNKSKTPLDFVPPLKPSMKNKTIDTASEKVSAPIVGVNLVPADELQINENELKELEVSANINDITDFGDFTNATVIEDATEFPLVNGTEAVITEAETKENKETK